MNLILLITTYKYLILLPLAIVEGPIITVIAGFFVSFGAFNAFFVYPIMILGDIIGDTILYYIGHSGGKIFGAHLQRYFKVTPEKLQQVNEYFSSRNYRPIIFSKIMHGVGIAGLVAAGSAHVPFKKYFSICFLTSVIQSAVLLLVGILFGHAYLKIGHYLNFFAAGTVILAIVILLVIFIKKSRIKKPL